MDENLSNNPRAGDELAPRPATIEFGARKRSKGEHALLSSYWFANNFHWGALLLILMPGDINLMDPANRATTLAKLTSLGAVFALVIPLWAAVVSDRSMNRLGRRRPFLALGTIINVVGLLLMAAAVNGRSIPMYAIGFMVVQLGNNLALGPYMGVMPDLVVPEERGLASGFMALMSQLGTLLGAFGVGVALGGQPAFVRYGLVASILVIGIVIGWRAIDEKPLMVAPPKMDWGGYIKSLWIDPKAHPDFFWVWITRFLVMLGFYAVLPQVNYYLIDVVRIAPDDVEGKATMLLGIILIVSSFSGVYGGVLSDKIGRKKVVFLSNGLIAIFSLGFIFARDFWTALAVGAVFGLGYGAYISVDYALGNDVLPDKDEAGKDMAVWHIAMTLPQVLAAPIAGELIAAGGKTLDPVNKMSNGDPLYHYGLGGYVGVFVLCSVCFALGAVLLRNVRGVR